MAQASAYPPVTDLTAPRSGGMSMGPPPHAQYAVSSSLMTHVTECLPSMALTLPRSSGNHGCDMPQHLTSSSIVIAHPCTQPSDTALTDPRSAGGKRPGSLVSPQHCNWSS